LQPQVKTKAALEPTGTGPGWKKLINLKTPNVNPDNGSGERKRRSNFSKRLARAVTSSALKGRGINRAVREPNAGSALAAEEKLEVSSEICEKRASGAKALIGFAGFMRGLKPHKR
jgi:hypothetical protein